MYGEKINFVQGSGAPITMLTAADSVFVTIRSAARLPRTKGRNASQRVYHSVLDIRPADRAALTCAFLCFRAQEPRPRRREGRVVVGVVEVPVSINHKFHRRVA